MLSLILVLFTICGVSGWLWHSRHFSYWRYHGVPFIPVNPLVGNLKDLLLYRCCFGEQFRRLYNHRAAQGKPFVGIHVLHNHALLLRDPALIKRVLVQDFSAFASRFETADPVGDHMGSLNLFFAKYEIWKDIHSMFSPLFAYRKVKQIYPLLQEIGIALEEHIVAVNSASSANYATIEVKELCALFTTDLTASLAFGLQAHSLQNPSADFRRMCIEVNDPRPKRILHLFTMFFFPNLVTRLRTHLYSEEYEQFMRQSIEFAIAERVRSGVKRHDLIDVFIKLQQQAEMGDVPAVVHQPDFYAAQAAFLLLAGFDTSSSTIAFTLYELARHSRVQQRVREELRAALMASAGSIACETLQHLMELGMVISEVLRLYPATSFLDRCCNLADGYTLQPWTNYKVPKGMPVYIPVLALHRDEQYWPEPHKFKPERFSAEQRSSHTPMAYLPFGSGPRGCVGYMLGLLQVRTGLLHILKRFRVETCDQTPHEIQFDPKAFVLTNKGGIMLRFVHDQLYEDGSNSR